MRTYRITRGARSDRGGATVWFGRNECLTANYAADGTHQYGDLPGLSDLPLVAAAVSRVIATGETEIITTGEPAPVVAAPRPIVGGCTLWTAQQGCPLHGETCHQEEPW